MQSYARCGQAGAWGTVLATKPPGRSSDSGQALAQSRFWHICDKPPRRARVRFWCLPDIWSPASHAQFDHFGHSKGPIEAIAIARGRVLLTQVLIAQNASNARLLASSLCGRIWFVSCTFHCT